MTTTTPAPPFAGIAEWDGTSLKVTDKDTLGKLRRKALSASTSKSFQGCAARWVGERLLRDREAEDPFDPAPLGTAAHSVLEDLFGLPPKDRTKERAYKILMGKADAQWAPAGGETRQELAELAAKQAEWIAAVQHCYIGLWKTEDPTRVIVKGREFEVKDIDVEGVPMIGYIDRVAIAQDFGPNEIELSDYKSGKVPDLKWGDDHGDQLRLYKAAWLVLFGVTVARARVIYTAHGVDRDVDLSDEAMAKTLAKWKASWAKHNRAHDTGKFPTKTSALCGWCPLVNACPSAEAAAKTARKDGLPSKAELGIGDPAAPETLSAVRAKARAAHMESAGEEPRDTDNPEESMARITEDKSWEERTQDGELNPNSYASMAVFGLAELAVEQLHRDGQAISGPNVQALARTFHAVAAEAQHHWTGSSSLQAGASTRMRGALRTVLNTLPLPWDQPSEAWQDWQAKAVRRCGSIAKVALGLWEDGVVKDEPWKALANDPETPAEHDADPGEDGGYSDEEFYDDQMENAA